MSKKVFPKIEKAFAGTSGIREVIVQQDGARPHTGKDVVNRLNELGAACSPRIVLRTQPAQSPDLNVNDLALFRALDVAVRKLAAVWHGPFGRVEQGAACARCDEGGDVLPSRAAHQYVGLQV